MKRSLAAVSCSVTLLLTACGTDSPSTGVPSTTPATATTSTAAPTPTSSIAGPDSPTSTTLDTAATIGATTTSTGKSTETSEDAAPGPTSDITTNPTGSSDSTATSGSGADGSGSEFIPVGSPVVPGSTEPLTADGSQADGVYYASVGEGGDPGPATGSVVFEVVQLFTGPDCIAHFGEAEEDACVNDYGVETDPTAYVEVALDGQFISVVDAATQQSYQISGARLHDLILGGAPADDGPPDYVYSGFGFLVTYEGGEITRLEQWWTP